MRRHLILIATVALVSVGTLAGTAIARDRSESVDLTVSQISDQATARAAQLKADLRLTADQEKSWAGFETAIKTTWSKQVERRIAWRNAHSDQNANADEIDEMRKQADAQIEISNDRKKLADAAAPLYKGLDDQQKRRFSGVLFGRDRDRSAYD